SDRASRADAAARLARGGIHDPDPRRRRVQSGRARARGGGPLSAVAQVQQLPRLPHTGRVTQLRVAISEWTKLRSLRSTRWSLLVAVLLTILFPVLFAA